MIQDVVTRSADFIWPILSLVIFVLCFVGVVIWVYRGKKNRFEREASLPLDVSPTAKTASGVNHVG